MSVGSRTLEVQLDALLATLHSQVGWGRGEVAGELWGQWGRPGQMSGVELVGTWWQGAAMSHGNRLGEISSDLSGCGEGF